MASSTTTEADLRNEIARLTESINQHKTGVASSYTGYSGRPTQRSNTYINPNYKPPSNKYIRPSSSSGPSVPSFRPAAPSRPKPPSAAPTTSEVKDVVLNGVAFESSGRSLVRKDLPKPKPKSPAVGPNDPALPPTRTFTRKSGHLIPTGRVHKPKISRGRRGMPMNRNMTLKTTQERRRLAKKMKYNDRPCPRFTTTGACSRGLTCPYKHDPSKIAICWNFLQGHCPNTAETCNLSHDPTPERTPLCVHFVNRGRCTRDKCPFPHVNVGKREGVCRDFAVLGYCAKGLECEHQHVRECPDFAEKGTCQTRGCKLPHVIRANRGRKATETGTVSFPTVSDTDDEQRHEVAARLSPSPPGAESLDGKPDDSPVARATDGQLGDEYISLVFNESDESDDAEDEVEGDAFSDVEMEPEPE